MGREEAGLRSGGLISLLGSLAGTRGCRSRGGGGKSEEITGDNERVLCVFMCACVYVGICVFVTIEPEGKGRTQLAKEGEWHKRKKAEVYGPQSPHLTSDV